MVADGHGLVAQQVHALEVGHGVLQIRLGHAGVDVATVKQQALPALCRHVGADAVNHRLARSHAVLTVAVLPKAAMVVVGVHHGDAVGLVFLRAKPGGVGAG